jgi:hypothetical protein
VADVYELTIKGAASDVIRAEFDDLTVTVEGRVTRLRFPIRDPASLYGLIRRIEALGLELIELRLAESEGLSAWSTQ